MAIVSIDYDSCSGCGMCVKVCAVDVIRMDREEGKPVIKYPEDCMLCEMCIRECLEDAISFTPEKYIPPLVSWG